MKNHIIFSVLFFATLPFVVSAKCVEFQSAQNIAENFSPNKVVSRSGITVTLAYKGTNYYVFNYENGGYVIVSGSDLTDEILGYSKTGIFNEKNIPENMKSFLQNYDKEIEYAEKNNINGKSVKSRSSDSKSNIEPLIKSKWNQGYPYNVYCPEKNGQKTLTGCVATAMAQVVAYHKSKTDPTGFHSYNGRDIDLDTCTINYENLCIKYSGNETIEQIHEIAKLMKMCGYTTDMSYGINSSTSNTSRIKESLVKYFDYNEDDAEWIVRYTYDSEDDWENEIYNSLNNANPVVYKATTENGSGHCFICDGYEDGYFHINWGWGENFDNYFKLTALCAGGYNFSFNNYENSTCGHAAIVNLHPNEINVDKESDSLNPNTSYSLNNSKLDIEYVNNGLYTGPVVYGFLTVNEQNDTTALTPKQIILESGNQTIVSTSISDLNLDNGITKLIPVIYIKDNVKRIIESDIYAVVTSDTAFFTEDVVATTVVSSISLSPNKWTGKVGETITITATLRPKTAIDKTLTWSSSNETVATVDQSGKVTAVALGEAVITAASSNPEVSATCKVTVVPTAVSAITLNPTEWSGEVGESFTITATVAPEAATDKTLRWTSSNEAVAKVDANGKVTAIALGEATITVATSNPEVTATCKVKVLPTAVSAITIDPKEWAGEVGESFTINAIIEPDAATDKTLTWSSSNEAVATVNADGMVTAVAVGEAVITVKAGEVSATCAVTVVPTLVESITLDPTEWSGAPGESFTIIATIAPENATDKTLVWTSSDATVASVDSEGRVEVLRNGTCTITASTTDGSALSAECVITGLSGFDALFVSENEQADVYDIKGSLVRKAAVREDMRYIVPGVYILKFSNRTVKVAIR